MLFDMATPSSRQYNRKGFRDDTEGVVMSWFELWWIFPAAVAFSTIAIGSGVSGALFFSPFFMLVVGLSPVQAVGAALPH